MLMALVFLIGFVCGSFVTSYLYFVSQAHSQKAKKTVKQVGSGIVVQDRFYSNVSGKFMENNIN
jgi:uncharacterized membrane protein YciS (DUF1049 family)